MTEVEGGSEGGCDSTSDLLEMEQNVCGHHGGENPLTEREGVEETSGGVVSTSTVSEV